MTLKQAPVLEILLVLMRKLKCGCIWLPDSIMQILAHCQIQQDSPGQWRDHLVLNQSVAV